MPKSFCIMRSMWDMTQTNIRGVAKFRLDNAL